MATRQELWMDREEEERGRSERGWEATGMANRRAGKIKVQQVKTSQVTVVSCEGQGALIRQTQQSRM